MGSGQDQLFFTATYYSSCLHKMHRVDHLVLQKGAYCAHEANTAPADKKVTDFHAWIGAIVANIAQYAHFDTVIVVWIHNYLNNLSRGRKVSCGWCMWKTLKTFSVKASD